MTYGNSSAQDLFRQSLLLPGGTSLAACLVGSPHLGKASFARELLTSELHEADFMEMEPGIDGARQAVEFSRTDPVGSPVRAVLVDDADRLGEPAQDALLKLLEEAPPFLAVVLVAHDLGRMQPALASRVRTVVRWEPLSDDEMRAFAGSMLLAVSDFALGVARGLPGMYKIVAELAGFDELRSSALRAARRELSLLSPVPAVVKDLENGPGPVRDAAVHVLRGAAREVVHNSAAAGEILRFCAVLSGSTSANAEIHWMRMVSALSV